PCRDARIGDELLVACLAGDLLLLGPADRMAARCRETQPTLFGQARRSGPQLQKRFPCLDGRRTDLRGDLERRREKLTLDRAGQPRATSHLDQLSGPRSEEQGL